MTTIETLIERIPLRTVKWLKTRTFKEFEADYEARLVREPELNKKKSTKKQLTDYYNLLQTFCDKLIKRNGIMKRDYRYSLTMPTYMGGRLFSGGSIQGIAREYRSLLLNGVTTDIDMKNAHPVILRYICKIHTFPCPELEYYVNHRDEVLKDWSNRGIGKTAYLQNTNNDKYTGAISTESPEVNYRLRQYANENKKIQKYLISLPDYKDLIDSIPEDKTWNKNGSAMNRILCYFENIILTHCKKFLSTTKQIEICVNMFDGCEVYGNYYQDTGLLKNIEEYVESKMMGLGMKWDYKEHETVHCVPDDFDENSVSETSIAGIVGEDDVGAAKRVIELFSYWKFCKGVLYVFDDETGLWNTDEINHLKVIGKYPDELVVLKEIKGKEGGISYEKTTKSYGKNTRLMKQIIPQIKTLCMDDAWLENGENSSLGKLLFTNGYLNLKEGKFYDEFNPDILFFGRIHRDWTVPKYVDELDYMQDIKLRLFVNPLGEKVGNYLLLNLARGLAGDLMKRNLFGLGGTNCGKSTITNALMKSCGDYVDTFNAENLAHKNSGHDEAQLMRWVMLLKHCRLIISNEMKSNIVLNGNFIKKLSGRDPLKGREHYGNEVTFRTHFLPICFANDLPKITPFDDAVNERLRVVDFPKQFKKEPSNEYELLADPNIEEEMKSSEFQMGFLRLLIKTYWEFVESGVDEVEPEEVIRAKNDWVGIETIDFIEAFKEDFIVTNDPKDFVLSSDIEYWIKNTKDLGISIEKFAKELKKYCSLSKYDKVDNKVRKINSKPKRVWIGIKRYFETDEDEDGDNNMT